MARLFFKLSLPAVLVIGLTYLADPMHVFHRFPHGSEEEITNLLIRGQNVAGVSVFDDRLVQRFLIEMSNRRNDIIVFGSSRTMELNAEDFPQQVFFNHSVAAGSIEDFIALYGMYQRRHSEPDTIVMNLDPWFLNRNSGVPRLTTLSDDFERTAQDLGIPTSLESRASYVLAKLLVLLSPSYFQTAIRSMAQRVMNPKPYAVRAADISDPLLLADGSRRYGKDILDRTSSDVWRIAAAIARSKPMVGLGDFGSLDPNTRQVLERFIDYLQERRMRVILLLLPYHPLPYAVIRASSEYRCVLETEQYLRHLAAMKGILAAGSYDPHISGCSDVDFFDAVHPKNRCIERILTTSVAERFPDLVPSRHTQRVQPPR